jgi:O-antigen/teichoic acid export membrane protein
MLKNKQPALIKSAYFMSEKGIITTIRENLSMAQFSLMMVIALPTLASLIVNALAGKIIALYIDPAEFGVYSLQFVLFSFANAVFLVPIVNTFKTFRKDIDLGDSTSFFDGAILLSSLFTGLIFSVVLLYSNVAISIIPLILMTLLLLFQGWYSIRLAQFQLSSDFKSLGWYTVFTAASSLIILCILSVFLKIQNHVSIWLATLTSALLTLFIVTHKSPLNKITFPWEYKSDPFILQKMTTFIWPLMLVALMSSINNYADRYLIEILMTTRDVGIYAAGYGLGSKVLFLMTPILVYLTPVVYNNIKLRPDIVFRTIHKILLFHALAGICVCSVLYFLRTPVGNIFLSQSYLESFEIIPLIGFGFLFYNAVFAIETYFYASGNSRMILYHNILGAVVNIVLNILLIPYYGIMGAAAASLLSFAAQFLFCYIIMNIHKGQTIIIDDKNFVV